MTALLSTYRYGDATPEEEMEQSNIRLMALREIADYIDSINDNPLAKIIEVFINEPKFNEHSWEELSAMNASRNNFIKRALQDAIEEQKKAELKTKIICLLYKVVEHCFDTFSDFNQNFPTETRKTIEKAIKYAYYALDVKSSGRSVEDIFKLSMDKICTIADCECSERWEEIEQFVLKNKVGNQYLKRIVQLINENNAVELEAAFKQAKAEAKAKREDIKSGTPLQQRYKRLKRNYKYALEDWGIISDKFRESEKLRRKFQYRSEKWSKLNTELNEQIKTIRKALRKKTPDITEIKNIVGMTDKNSTEQETKNNISPEIINIVEYFPMVIKDSYPITS